MIHLYSYTIKIDLELQTCQHFQVSTNSACLFSSILTGNALSANRHSFAHNLTQNSFLSQNIKKLGPPRCGHVGFSNQYGASKCESVWSGRGTPAPPNDNIRRFPDCRHSQNLVKLKYTRIEHFNPNILFVV